MRPRLERGDRDGAAGRRRDDGRLSEAAFELDRATRWLDSTTLLGGAPARLFRLTAAGAAFVRERRAARTPAERALAARLAASGALDPRPSTGPYGPDDVTVVVPVHRDPHGLAATLASVPHAVVVDDDEGRGPAAARNEGRRQVTTPLVAFLDAGCVPEPGWLEVVLPQFDDPAVVAVAPRVRATPGDGVLARYERARSPLDMGDRGGPVRPGTWAPYVPTAALVVRRDALEAVGGFDESLRYGEDVDLVWRLGRRGVVRYQPTAVVHHPPRPDLPSWLRQRFAYGTSAAPLAARHGDALAPFAGAGWSVAAWALTAAGQPVAGAAVVASATVAATTGELPPGVAAELTLTGHVRLGGRLAEALRRTWWPLSLVAALASRRARRVAVASLVPLVADWRRDGRPVALGPYVALRLLDDLAYGAGVWAGCARARSWAALRPKTI